MRVLALLFAVWCPLDAAAYGCSRASSIGEAVERGDQYVFRGTVLSTTHVDDELGAVEFEVQMIYRGSPEKRLTVFFGGLYEERPFKFRRGETYLVSASRGLRFPSGPMSEKFGSDKVIHSNMCGLRKRVRESVV